MRLHVLSDLHLEFGDWTPPSADADVVILAGDIHKDTRAIPWIERHFPDRPVLYVAGNHEFYGETVSDVFTRLHAVTRHTNIRFLEQEDLELGEVVFLGCTLWTDFNLHGDPATAGRAAATGMNDYRLIRTLPGYRRLKGRDTAKYHVHARQWLEGKLTRHRGRKVVVLTHHAPSSRSLDPKFAGDILGAAYASRLDGFVEASGAALWVHGHTHRSVDYTIGATRVLANQRGYPEQVDLNFRPTLVVEI